jgi:hypothetical protein
MSGDEGEANGPPGQTNSPAYPASWLSLAARLTYSTGMKIECRILPPIDCDK